MSSMSAVSEGLGEPMPATPATMDAVDWRAEGDTCVTLLRDLLRIPTVNRGTNAPGDGNERPAAELLAEFLRQAGVEPRIYEKTKGRANVVARIKGTGERAPLLLNAHLDVVEADESRWKHPPFAGVIEDGWLWGRGAVDMKNMAAMSACVLALLARQRVPLARDVIFAGVADEEAACTQGSLFLVDEHPDAIRAEYALGEIGAFSQHLFGRTFYPIQVAEKGIVWVRATFDGEPGHGSMPKKDSAVNRLARAIGRLSRRRLPVHPTPVVRGFIDQMAAELPRPQSDILKRLTTPRAAALILDYLVRDPDQERSFGAMLSNTASPTILRGGSKVNVIPGRASVDIDGRILPGQTESSFLLELREAFGKDGRSAKLDVLSSQPPTVTSANTPLFTHLARTIRKHDPAGIPAPYMIPGFTDAMAYAKLGTKCYGFSPVRFEPDSGAVFSRMYHGDDERIPVDGLKWGLRVLYDAVRGFVGGQP
jgi:acetylornithine deacetylase/succinyl-diaminopimelate desuccinylase-like protein